jgi:phosphomannomutase
MAIRFGTDGWRAIIGQDFTFDNVRACAQGVALHLKELGLVDRGMVVGYDTRFESEDFAQATTEVLAGNGIPVYLTSRPTPTPVISFAVGLKHSAGAVIITASHNPYRYNGFKYRTPDGASAPWEVLEKIEKHIQRTIVEGKPRSLPLLLARKEGMVHDLDPMPAYAEQVRRLVPVEELKEAGLKVVADSMYGAGAGYLKTLLGGGQTQVLELHGERNPLFPGLRPEPIAENLTELSQAVEREGAQIGLANDGDADRMGVVDEKGSFINQAQVFPLLALYLLEVRGQRGAIIKTVTSSRMLFRLGELFGVPVFETPIGFRYVAPLMVKEDAILGGEESGGYGFRGHALERDGILGGLFFLDLMRKTGKTPSQLVSYLFEKVGTHYFQRHDLTYPPERASEIEKAAQQAAPKFLAGQKVVSRDTVDGFRFIMADGSWLLVRFSRTEPLLRVYAEGLSSQQVEELLKEGQSLAGL